MKKWEIWIEGTKKRPEEFLGKFEGDSFEEAVINFRNCISAQTTLDAIDLDKMTFDNRKFFTKN